MCERELETEQNCNILTPTLLSISVSFPISRAAQPEARGPTLPSEGFLNRILSPTGLQSHWLPVFTELYNSSIAYSISPHNWPSGCVTSAVLGMACLIVIKRKLLSCSSQVTLFRCISLWLYLVPYCQPSPHTLMEYATFASLEWHVWPGRRSIYNTTTHSGFGSQWIWDNVNEELRFLPYCP